MSPVIRTGPVITHDFIGSVTAVDLPFLLSLRWPSGCPHRKFDSRAKKSRPGMYDMEGRTFLTIKIKASAAEGKWTQTQISGVDQTFLLCDFNQPRRLARLLTYAEVVSRTDWMTIHAPLVISHTCLTEKVETCVKTEWMTIHTPVFISHTYSTEKV